MPNDIAFFSYSRNDSDFALRLAKDLRKAGVKLWIDQLDIRPGSHWDASIESGLNAANCMIVILTPASIASNNVMDEVSYALESGKRVIPILWKQCNTPFRLRRLQRIDFTGEYNDGINQLLEALDYPVDSRSTPAETEAKKPQQQVLTSQQETKTPEENKETAPIKKTKKRQKTTRPITGEEIGKKNEIEISEPTVEKKQDQEIDVRLHQLVADAMAIGKTKQTPIYISEQDSTVSENRKQISVRPGAFHLQKLMLTIVGSFVLLSMFLPWAADDYFGGTFTGLKLISNSEGAIGLFVLLCCVWSFAIILLSVIGNRSQAFKGVKKFMTVTAFILLIITSLLIIIQLEDHSVKPATGLFMTFILGVLGILLASGILKFGAGIAGFHKQRLNLAVIVIIAFISSFLPWINYNGYGSVSLIQMRALGFPLIGWLLLVLNMVAIIVPFIGNKSGSITGALKVIAIILFSLMICFAIYIIGAISINDDVYGMKPGIGSWLALISALVGLFVLLRVIKFGSK